MLRRVLSDITILFQSSHLKLIFWPSHLSKIRVEDISFSRLLISELPFNLDSYWLKMTCYFPLLWHHLQWVLSWCCSVLLCSNSVAIHPRQHLSFAYTHYVSFWLPLHWSKIEVRSFKITFKIIKETLQVSYYTVIMCMASSQWFSLKQCFPQRLILYII